MDSPLPPDPYAALGVPRDADASLIKATYRKIVLKTHPDKFTDEAVKRQKQEEFHKIQQAYEIIGDEERRAKHDAEVRLQQFRKEKLSKAGSGGTRVEVHTSQYGVRTAAPADASFPKPRYEERKPTRSASYDEDRYYEDRSSSRKYDTYESYPKRSPPRTSREKETPKTTRAATDRIRSDAKKSRDKEERRDRSGKYRIEEEFSSADEKARFEAQVKEREKERRRMEEAEETQRAAAEARRRADDRRSAEDMRKHRSGDGDPWERKFTDLEAEARNYIHRTKDEIRPSPGRTGSRDARPEHYSSRRGSEAPRRSSARPKESSRPMSSGRDRERKVVFPEIVEWESREKDRVPSLKPSVSSPPEIPIVRAPPQRSYTEASGDYGRRRDTSPTPLSRRAETVPTVHIASSSSRRQEPSLSRAHDSGYSTSSSPDTAFPTIPPPSGTKKVYHYPTSGGGIRLTPEDIEVVNGHRAIRREPGHDDRHRPRSPSPLSRPPIGNNRIVQPSSSSRYAPAPQPPRTATIVPPTLGRSATMNMTPDRRSSEDRGRRLFGEVSDADYFKRENSRRQPSYNFEKVIYADRPGPEDIRWSSGREAYPGKERDYSRPMLRKHETAY